jgi:hypothetical protein
MTDVRDTVEEGRRKWGEWIDLRAEKTTIPEITEFVRFKDLEYESIGLKDLDPWETYKEDFQDFSTQNFRNCKPGDIRRLRTTLRANGVWVQKPVPRRVIVIVRYSDTPIYSDTPFLGI